MADLNTYRAVLLDSDKAWGASHNPIVENCDDLRVRIIKLEALVDLLMKERQGINIMEMV